MAKAPTTVARDVTGKVTNPLDIQWPQDEYGFTTMLRKEGARAIGRIQGDATKMRVLLDTLEVLRDHAEAKLADHVNEVARNKAASDNIRAAAEARAEADRKEQVKRAEADLVAAQARLEALGATDGE